jgi:hypothetical protein
MLLKLTSFISKHKTTDVETSSLITIDNGIVI